MKHVEKAKMKLFYRCNCFKDNLLIKNSFEIEQNELLLKHKRNQNKFLKLKVKYKCKYSLSREFSNKKPCLLIPIKDNSKLLDYTLKNLLHNNVHLQSNIVIIDDRSQKPLNSFIDDKFITYFRIDNDKGFNFSMLNNIPAKVFYDLGCDTVVFWNSDLWCYDKFSFGELISRHKENKSSISGSKLLYPPIEKTFNKDETPTNIRTMFSERSKDFRGKVQFGGSCFVPSGDTLFPVHSFRFRDPSNFLVDCDKGELFVTGALQVINLKKFIELGGLNPSLATQFQDVDLCLRFVESDLSVFYFGKKLFFYHDESLSLCDKKQDIQAISDHIIYSKIWTIDRLKKIIF